MPDLNPAVRPATPDDHEAAAEVLALAFAEDPAWGHLIPDGGDQGERLLVYFSAEIENLVPEYRQLWVTEDGSGAAVWGAPGRWRVPTRRGLRTMRPAARAFGRRLPRAFWTQTRFERLHPRKEHWYLHFLGVEPRRQGRGLGSALMAPVLRRCDEEGTCAFLEASTERNRALYERNGFSRTGTFNLPVRGPVVHEMWRDPNRDQDPPGPAR
jgi:ribosomal protein S18 acetylase RimI-like enzyme